MPFGPLFNGYSPRQNDSHLTVIRVAWIWVIQINVAQICLHICMICMGNYKNGLFGLMGLNECITDFYTHWWIQTDGKIQACNRENQCRNCWNINPISNSGALGNNFSNDISTFDFIGNDDTEIFENLLVMP